MSAIQSILGAQPGGSLQSTSTGSASYTQLSPAKPDSFGFSGSQGGGGQKSHFGIIGSLIACCAAVPILLGLGAVGVGLYFARNTVGGLLKLAGKAGSGIKHLAQSHAANVPQLPQVMYRP